MLDVAVTCALKLPADDFDLFLGMTHDPTYCMAAGQSSTIQ